MRFDPNAVNRQLHGSTGFEFDLSSSFEEAKEVGGLASSAHAFLNTGIACLLVKLTEPAERLFRMARDWLLVAIDEDERPQRYFPDGTESTRFSDRALLSWLLENVHDADSLAKSLEHKSRYLSGPAGRDRVSVELSVVDYVDAGHLNEAVRLVHRAGIRRPIAAKKVTNEAQLVYWLAEYGLDSEEGHAAMRMLLDRSMDNWLTRGHYWRAVRWTKILYWARGASGLSPVEAVLKCYRHLDCEPL